MKRITGIRSIAVTFPTAVALIVFQAASAVGGVIGSGVAGPNGNGTIEVSLAQVSGGQTVPGPDIEKVTSIVSNNVQLSNGALPRSVEVAQQGDRIGGVIGFSGAPPGSTVQAELPDDVERRLAGAFLGGGAAAAAGGTSTAAIVGGVGLVVVGGTVGGLYAAGVIGDDDDTPNTGSIGPGGPPPGPPPVQPPPGPRPRPRPPGQGGPPPGQQPPASLFQ